MRINRMGGDVELLRYFPVSCAESHQAHTIQGRGRAPLSRQACCPAGLMGPRAPMRASGPEIPHPDRTVSARAAATRGPRLGEVITELRAVEDQHLVTEIGCHAEHSAERAHICAQSPHLRVNSTAHRLPVRLLVDGRPAHQDRHTYRLRVRKFGRGGSGASWAQRIAGGVTAPPFASCRAGGLWPELGRPV